MHIRTTRRILAALSLAVALATAASCGPSEQNNGAANNGATNNGANNSMMPECDGNATVRERKCDGDVMLRCGDDGTFQEYLDCGADGNTCQKDENDPLGARCVPPAESCEPNKRYCDGTTVMNCNVSGEPNGVYQECADTGKICEVVAGVATCVEESSNNTSMMPECDGSETRPVRKCDGDTLLLCSRSDVFAPFNDCASRGEICVEDPEDPYSARCAEPEQMVECDASATVRERKCDGDTMLICGDDGTFETYLDCSTSGNTCREYENDPLGVRCVPAEQECSPNKRYCDGATVRNCDVAGKDAGVYEECADSGETCEVVAGVATCVDPNAMPVCVPGTLFCDENKVMFCDFTGMFPTERSDCTSQGYVCDVSGGYAFCVDPNAMSNQICQPNTYFCDGPTTISYCQSTGLSSYAYRECANTNKVCDVIGGVADCVEPGGATQTCVPNKRYCDGTTVMNCDVTGAPNGAYEDCAANSEVCDIVGGVATCVDPNAGAPTCVPYQRYCDGTQVRFCDNLGNPGAIYRDCALDNEICDSAGGVVGCVDPNSPPACVADQRYCDGTKVRACDPLGNPGLTIDDCALSNEVCDVVSGVATCVDASASQICAPGTMFCNGNEVAYCDFTGMSSSTLSDCASQGEVCESSGSYAFCVDPNASNQICQPNTYFCDGPTTISYCQSTGLSSYAYRECANTNKVCDVIGGVADCVEPGGATQTCVPNRRYCDGAVIMNCDATGAPNGAFKDCAADNEVCNIIGGVATCVDPNAGAPSCVPGERYCDGAQVRYCDASGNPSTIFSDCSLNNEICDIVGGLATCVDPNQTTPTCTANRRFCDGTTIRNCDITGTPGSVYKECADTNDVCDVVNGVATCINPNATAVSCAPNVDFCDGATTVRACNSFGVPGQAVQDCALGNEVCDLVGGVATCVDPNPATPPPVCVANARYCDGTTTVRECDASGNPGAVAEDCSLVNEICDVINGEATCVSPNTGLPTCDPGKRFCDGTAIRYCNNQGVPGSVATECADTGKVCAVSGGAAVCVDPCPANERYCEGDELRLCNGDGTSSTLIETCSPGNCDEAASPAFCDDPSMNCMTGYRWDGVSCVDANECLNGTAVCDAICQNTDGGYDCVSSVSDASSPYWADSCTLSQYLNNPTDLDADCRCTTNKSLTGGLDVCWRPFEAYTRSSTTFGAGPRIAELPQVHIYGGFMDATARELVVAVDWKDTMYDHVGAIFAVNVDTGARRVISGRTVSPSTGYAQVGAGPDMYDIKDVRAGSDGKYYVFGGTNTETRVYQVDPATGDRSLAWERDNAAFGQCLSGRLSGADELAVQTTPEAFALGPQDDFFMAFANTSLSGEGVGVIKVSNDGQTCEFVSRTAMGAQNTRHTTDVGGGYATQGGYFEGMTIRNGKIYAVNALDLSLYEIDLATGDRARVTSASTTSPLGMGPTGGTGIGRRWMTYDTTRNLWWTSGFQGGTVVVTVDPATGNRTALNCSNNSTAVVQDLFCLQGSLGTGLSLNYGGFWIDPTDSDTVYFAHDSMGIVRYEGSTGNSIILSL